MLRTLLIFLALGLSSVISAEPVPESERIPVDVRRTTLVVRDIDRSLPLYRDALGLNVIYDQMIGGGMQPDGSTKPPTIRLVLMRANDTYIGVLGLMQRLNQPHPKREKNRKAQAGDTIIVINAKDLKERWAKVAATPHIEVETPPTPIEYPAQDGGKIPVLFSAVWDADGNYIEINQLLGAPAGTPTQPAKPKN
jgi:catechol 2,3-dioxygenase-like lactoylglutathione lyase family enzyme